MSAQITITGTLGADPELKFTPSGAAIVNLRVVTDTRFKDDAGKWQSRDTSWWRVTAWRQLAENTAETLAKGDKVIIVGKIKQREYEANDGEKKSVVEVEATNIGPDLSKFSANISRVQRDKQANVFAGDDPWATSAVLNTDGEAPF
jgi:single-strand DNA-binding protein